MLPSPTASHWLNIRPNKQRGGVLFWGPKTPLRDTTIAQSLRPETPIKNTSIAQHLRPENHAQEHNNCPAFASWKPHSRTQVLPSICVRKISLSNISFVQHSHHSKNNFEHEEWPLFPPSETQILPNICVLKTPFRNTSIARGERAFFCPPQTPPRDTTITQH